jgi:hypothetical protein
MSILRLTGNQLIVLRKVARGTDEYLGNDGHERRTCRSLVRRGFLRLGPVGALPLFELTDAGRDREASDA